MRCFMVVRSELHFTVVIGACNLGWAFLEMVKMALWFFFLVQFSTCFYFFAGRVALRYGKPSWLLAADFLIPAGSLPAQPLWTQFGVSLYYMTVAATGGEVPIENGVEAFLYILILLGIALVFTAYIFGIVIGRIEEIHEAKGEMQEVQDKLVEMCQLLDVPDKVERKVVRKWLDMAEAGLPLELEDLGDMLA